MTLREVLAEDGVRPRLIDDCVLLIDTEVKRKSGFSGLAIKGAYTLVKAIKPGFIAEVTDHLLDGFIVRLEPFYAAAPEGEAFAKQLTHEQAKVAEALLGFTDEKARAAKQATLRKAYDKLRPSAKEHVQQAVPGLAEILRTYM